MSSIRVSALSVLLMGALAFISGCSSTTTPSPLPPNGTPVSIVNGASTLTTTAFSPDVLDVAAGSTVVWSNADSLAHTTTSDDGVWSSGSLSKNAFFSFMFPTAGVFHYHCTIHPGMIGTVIVH